MMFGHAGALERGVSVELCDALLASWAFLPCSALLVDSLLPIPCSPQPNHPEEPGCSMLQSSGGRITHGPRS